VETSKGIVPLFPQGSGPDKGKTAALPVIWEKWSDFVAAQQKLEQGTQKLLQLAQAKDEAGFKDQVKVIGQACGGCHEAFRAKQSPWRRAPAGDCGQARAQPRPCAVWRSFPACSALLPWRRPGRRATPRSRAGSTCSTSPAALAATPTFRTRASRS